MGLQRRCSKTQGAMFLGKVHKEVNDFVQKQNTIAYHPPDGVLGMMMQQSSLIWFKETLSL